MGRIYARVVASGDAPTSVRVDITEFALVEDEYLERLTDDQLEDEAANFQDASEEDSVEVAGVNLEIANPRALSIRRLFEHCGAEMPAEYVASLGPSEPILLYHGLTAFAPPGAQVTPVWGMGIETAVTDVSSTPVSFAPQSEARAKASANTDVHLSLGLKGDLRPGGALMAGATHGLAMPGLHLSVDAKTSAELALSLRVEAIEVQAGPTDAGGVRWNLYRTGRALSLFQPFLQTLLIPGSASVLDISTQGWVSRRRRFRQRGVQAWRSEVITRSIALTDP